MRNQLPADPFDRIVELERGYELLRAEVAALRRSRTARSNVPRPLFVVRTTEWFDDPDYSYPTGNSAVPDLRLPITVLSKEVDDDGRPTYTNRTEYASHKAFCPMGWYPPGIIMNAWWDGGRYVIANAPTILHGLSTTNISSGSWSSGTLTLGTGTVNYCEETAAATYEEATYDDGSDVAMMVFNASDAVAANRGLTLGISEVGRWEVIVEPCNVVYE